MTTHLARRSIELIRANQAASGAYVASPTFPVYRDCWFRHGAYIAYAMDPVREHDSARRFYDWAAAMVARRATRAERAIAMASTGYAAVRDGLLHTGSTLDGATAEADWSNVQLDGSHTLLCAMAEHFNRSWILPGWEACWSASARPLLWSHAGYLTLLAHLDWAEAGHARD